MQSERDDTVWRRGLAWVEGQREQFALPARAADADDLFPLKVLAEMARVADVLARSPALAAPERARVLALLRFAWQQYGEGEVFAELLAARPYAVVGTMYSIFEGHGFSHAAARERLAALSSGEGVPAGRFPPRRDGAARSAPGPFGSDGAAVLALGLALAWRRMGLASPWSTERLFPLTRVSRRPPLESLPDEDAYSLTHVVFFVTDFGDRPDALDAGCREYLRSRAPAWMADELRRDNLDLYSELATALACAGEPLPAEVERVLALAQAGDGSLPGPPLRSQRRLAAAADPQRRRFLERYHTTLAGLLASFATTPGLARGPGRG